MRKLVLAFSLALLLVFVATPITRAIALSEDEAMMQDHGSDDMMEEGSDEEMMETHSLNSYELFWPVVAGRTRSNRLYIVKRLKERVRGLLIFGHAQKVDYRISLATKRVLETEQLVAEGREDLASATLSDANEELTKATTTWANISDRSTVSQDMVNELNNKLTNLQTFIPELEQQASQELSASLEVTLNLVNTLSSQI